MRYKTVEEFKSTNGYSIEGVWYPRVTKILDIKSKPALENFWREMGSFTEAENVKNKSAEHGSLVHSTIEKIVLGESIDIPLEIRPAVGAFFKFNEERRIVFHPGFVEKQIWSLRHRYAGTIDALATIDGKFGVLDIKTSTGFYPEYNLQTAAYVSALQEFQVKRALLLPQDIQTRWILRINQHRVCSSCRSTLRDKGGRVKIHNGKSNVATLCQNSEHNWGEVEGDIELKEFPYFYQDIKAFIAAKILWEWDNSYWLRQIGYIK